MRGLERFERSYGQDEQLFAATPAPAETGRGRDQQHASRVLLSNAGGDDIRITSSPRGISENSIAVHPLDGNVLLCANNSFNSQTFRNPDVHVAWSLDRGATWTSSAFEGARADPAVAIGREGTFYVSYINDPAPVGDGGLGLSVSTDFGKTWQTQSVFSGYADKSHLAIDNVDASPFAGRLYAGRTGRNREILVSWSADRGRSWARGRNVSQNQGVNQGVNLQTGPGGELYCCWSIYSQGFIDVPEDAIGFNVSLDGGNTFQGTQVIGNLRGTWPAGVPGFLKANSWPSMSVDRSDGQRNGWIYIFWTNVGIPGVNVGNPDIYMLRSRDGGSTWDTPILVNDDATNSAQWFAWSTCDDANGDLYVVFFDRREDPEDVLARTWVARSTDGGMRWMNQPVGDEQFLPVGAFGDYLGICAREGRVFPLWSDLRVDPVTAYTSPLVFDIRAPVVTCPDPLTVEGSTHGGALATDTVIAAFLDAASAQDEIDPFPEISTDAPEFFPLGTTTVTFTANDDAGNASHCSAPILVVDRTPPDLELRLNPEVLAPADHRLVPIDVTALVADVVDPKPSFALVSIGSSEADSGLGPGDLAKDIQQVELGTPDTRLLLRAESYSRDGRAYTLKYVARDGSGNTNARVLVVRVQR